MRDNVSNNCYCLMCRSFFTNTETFMMFCLDCVNKIKKGDEDETKDE